MNIEELIKLAESLNLQPVNEVSDRLELNGQNLNIAIDALYALEEIAMFEEDTNVAQAVKDARLYAEDYRRNRILNLTDEEGNI